MKKTLIYILISFFIVGCSNSIKMNTKNLAKKQSTIQLTEDEEINFGNAYIEGVKEKIIGNYDRATAILARALDINPRSAAAHYEMGLSYEGLGQLDDAFIHFEQANQLESDNFWYKLAYAGQLEQQGEINKAIETYKELIDLKPNDLELKRQLSSLLLGQGRYKESLKYINQIEDEIGINKDISFLKQQIYLRNDDVDGAANEIQKLIDAYPDELDYYVVLAEIYLLNGKEKKAFEVYKEVERIDSNNYIVQFALSEYYRLQNEHDKYFSSLNKAFSNPEMDIDKKVGFMLSAYQVKSHEEERKAEAISLCKTIVKAHPEDPKSYALLGDFLYFDNQSEEAKQAYINTVELDSSRFPIWNQLLIIMSETGDTDGLLNYGERAVNLFPNQPTLFFLYGLGLAEAGEHQEAINNYLMGADLALDNRALKSQLYSSAGDSYHSLKNDEKSDEYYEKALEIDPDNVYVLNNYSYYLSLRKKDMEKAEEMSKKANDLAPGISSFQDTYAWILYQQGNYKEANKWIDKALKADKEASGVILEHKGDILFRLNKKTEALKYWKKASEKKDASDEIHKKVEAGESYVFED